MLIKNPVLKKHPLNMYTGDMRAINTKHDTNLTLHYNIEKSQNITKDHGKTGNILIQNQITIIKRPRDVGPFSLILPQMGRISDMTA